MLNFLLIFGAKEPKVTRLNNKSKALFPLWSLSEQQVKPKGFPDWQAVEVSNLQLT